MKLYEFTYLIKPDLAKDDISSLQERIKSFITEGGGLIIKSNPPIKKILAYSIKKNKEAFLSDLTFELEPKNLKGLEKKIKAEKGIIRYLIFKKKVLRKKPEARIRRRQKAKTKVELKEIEKKLEEILGE